jgi:hypothetical protein
MTAEMPDKNINMSERAVLQHLSLTEWKVAHRLPVRAGALMLNQLARNGWIEVRVNQHGSEAHRGWR